MSLPEPAPANEKRKHRHSNPSPSHCIAAWCNGSEDDQGCGGPIPLYEFKDRRQDEGPHPSYYIDGRNPNEVLTALEHMRLGPHWPYPLGSFYERLRAVFESARA